MGGECRWRGPVAGFNAWVDKPCRMVPEACLGPAACLLLLGCLVAPHCHVGAFAGGIISRAAQHSLPSRSPCQGLCVSQPRCILLARSNAPCSCTHRSLPHQHSHPPSLPQTQFKRMYTTEAAKQIPDNSLDYVYVDAR